LKLLVVLSFALILAGCRPVLRNMQVGNQQQYLLQSENSLGQSFVAVYRGLEEIQFYISPMEEGKGVLILRITEGAQARETLQTAQLPVEAVISPDYYSFKFNSLPGSQQEYYYAYLEIEGSGSVWLHAAGAEEYREGALYVDHQPVEAQAKFRLGYQPAGLIAGLVKLGFGWVTMLTAGGLLFILPGLGLLHIVRPFDLDWVERTALGAGISLALVPILILWSGVAGLHLGAGYAWLLVLTGLTTAVMAVVRKTLACRAGESRVYPAPICDDNRKSKSSLVFQATLVGVLALLIFTRLWPLHNLDGPMWGDSVQHTVMTQLFLDNNGLFESWLPYASFDSLTVQFGFSAVTAMFAWLTGLSSLQATLWTGQILNLLAVLALYPLAVKVAGGQRWAGVGAILAAGLLSPTPAVYVNWGRYAQLAGQVILPAAGWLFWEALELGGQQQRSALRLSQNPSINSSLLSANRVFHQMPWKTILLTGLTLTGMTLTYYRMPFYFAAFAAALLVGWALPAWKFDLRQWGLGLTVALICGMTAVVSILPWIFNVTGGHLASAVEAGVTEGSQLENVLRDYQNWLNLFIYIPAWMASLALVALLASILKKQWLPASMALWAMILASLVALSLLRIPGANMIQNFAVIIAMYIPVALLTGWLVGWISGYPVLKKEAGQIGIGFFIILAGISGALNQRSLVRPDQYAMITRPDLRAMAWINENLAKESRFLVEGFTIYSGYTAVGSDAGWWLPLVAGRENTMPPQYALMNERPTQFGYTTQVVELVSHLETHQPSSPDGRRQLCEWRITHVYIGQRQGQVSLSRYQLFSPKDFISNPHFELVYHQDRVYIFNHKLESCEQP
jgi:hypothetical protein